MKTRIFTNGGIEVSEIGMGCMGFSHGYGRVPEAAYSIDAMRRAHNEAGCTFYDTAESYGDVMFHPGHNELLVGEAVEPFRQEIALATKMMLTPDELADGTTVTEAVERHLMQSLKNLRTDYVDIYYLHRVNTAIPVESVAEAMGALIGKGAIRGWGLSQVGVDTLQRAHDITPVTAVQNLYSIVERDCEKEIFPYCMANGIGVVPFSPVASGLLSGKVTTETVFDAQDDVRKWVPQLTKENIAANAPILDVVRGCAEAKHATMAQISLAWMLHKYPNVVPIPGSKNIHRILENLGAARVALTRSEFDALETALAACHIAGHRGHIETMATSFGNNWKHPDTETN